MDRIALIASMLSLLATPTIANDKTYEKCENPAYEGHPPKGKVLKWCCNQYIGVRGAYSLREKCTELWLREGKTDLGHNK